MWTAFDVFLSCSGVEETLAWELSERVSGSLNGMQQLVNGGSIRAFYIEADQECSAPAMRKLRDLICDADVGVHQRSPSMRLSCQCQRFNQLPHCCHMRCNWVQPEWVVQGMIWQLVFSCLIHVRFAALHAVDAVDGSGGARAAKCKCMPCRLDHVLQAVPAMAHHSHTFQPDAGAVLLDEHFLWATRPMCELRIMMAALTDPAEQPQPDSGRQPTPVVVPVVLMDDAAVAAAYERHWTPAAQQAARAEGLDPATLADLQRILTLNPIRQDQVTSALCPAWHAQHLRGPSS